MKITKAIYAFSGDPITYGHINIIERAAAIFSELTVGIGVNPAKNYLFTTDERVTLATAALKYLKNVKVTAFNGLLVDYAFEHNIPIIVRGLRNSEDFNMELLLHQIGESQQMKMETVFIPASQQMQHISSSAAKALQLEQGIIFEYVPLNVKQTLEEKLSGQYIIGITGEIASGKSYVSDQLARLADTKQIPLHNINVDKIGHQLMESLTEPLYHEMRHTLIRTFGPNITNSEGFVDRKKLGKIIFSDRDKLKQFNAIVEKPLLLKIRREMHGKKGIILVESALIAESKMTYLCNNNIIIVEANRDIQIARMKTRNYTEEQMQQRMNSQYSSVSKQDYIREIIRKDNYGKLYAINNTVAGNEQNVTLLFEELLQDMKLMSSKQHALE